MTININEIFTTCSWKTL